MLKISSIRKSTRLIMDYRTLSKFPGRLRMIRYR